MSAKPNYSPAAPAIKTEHRLLISSIQDLALDINALGRHHVHTHLSGHTLSLDIRVTEAPYRTGCQPIWSKTVYLPRNDDSPISRSARAIADLAVTVTYLTGLLETPEPRS